VKRFPVSVIHDSAVYILYFILMVYKAPVIATSLMECSVTPTLHQYNFGLIFNLLFPGDASVHIIKFVWSLYMRDPTWGNIYRSFAADVFEASLPEEEIIHLLTGLGSLALVLQVVPATVIVYAMGPIIVPVAAPVLCLWEIAELMSAGHT